MAAQNPNNQPSNDLSDVRTNGAANPNLSPTQLPIRGEKRIIPTPVNPNELSDAFNAQYTASGMDSPQASGYSGSRNQLVSHSTKRLVGDKQIKASASQPRMVGQINVSQHLVGDFD